MPLPNEESPTAKAAGASKPPPVIFAVANQKGGVGKHSRR
jgi:chromosome partitioning protein